MQSNKSCCEKCKHYNVFWNKGGCNLLNNEEHCKFEQKTKNKTNK